MEASVVDFASHNVPLELKPEKIIGRATGRGPTDRLHKEDPGMSDDSPADVNEPELAQSALELQRVASILKSHLEEW